MCKNCKAYNWEEARPQTFLVFSEKFIIWGLLSRLVPRPRPAFRHFEVHRFFFYMGEPGNEAKVTDFFFGVLVQCTKVVTLVCWLMSLPGAMFVLYCMLSYIFLLSTIQGHLKAPSCSSDEGHLWEPTRCQHSRGTGPICDTHDH